MTIIAAKLICKRRVRIFREFRYIWDSYTTLGWECNGTTGLRSITFWRRRNTRSHRHKNTSLRSIWTAQACCRATVMPICAPMCAAIAAANGNEEAIPVRNAAQAPVTSAEVEQARAKAAAWGEGGNSVNYFCQTEPEHGWGGETWTVDFDRWRVRWDTSGEYDDVKIDGDEIPIQELSGRVTAVINMKSWRYEARAIDVSAVVDIYYSKFGTCVISNK